ncbi:MAG: HNH endonuclease signature motif containing protein [Caldilineaceae bacterium]
MKPRKKHPEITKAILEQMYCEQGLLRQEIAEYFGVSVKTIGNRIREYGLVKTEGSPLTNTEDKHLPNGSIIYWSRRQDPYVPVKCGSCGRERMLIANNTTRVTFLGICRQCVNNEKWEDETLENGCVVYWSRRAGQRVPVRCARCDRERMTFASTIRNEGFTGLCSSCLHTGPESTTWRGGRTIKQGYIQVKVYPDHSFYNEMASTTGYIAEHRLVMAEHLGRPLAKTEVVHHKNGNKLDNRIENLELYVSFEEHGQALQERTPHPGYVPAKKLKRILQMIKAELELEEDDGSQ